MYICKLPAKNSFEKVGIKGKKFPLIDNRQKAGFTIIETEAGHETKIIEKACDFCYYILEGRGYFVIDGVRENCQEGDLVIVPAGKVFQYLGKLRMLLITVPPFYPEQEKTIPN